MDDPTNLSLGKIIMHGALALCGGVVREITHNKSYSLAKFVAGGFVGSFTGILAYCVCRHFGISEWGTAAITGMGGYCGSPLLDIGSSVLKRMAGKLPPDTKL